VLTAEQALERVKARLMVAPTSRTVNLPCNGDCCHDYPRASAPHAKKADR
jgi:hypothetical protein